MVFGLRLLVAQKDEKIFGFLEGFGFGGERSLAFRWLGGGYGATN